MMNWYQFSKKPKLIEFSSLLKKAPLTDGERDTSKVSKSCINKGFYDTLPRAIILLQKPKSLASRYYLQSS